MAPVTVRPLAHHALYAFTRSARLPATTIAPLSLISRQLSTQSVTPAEAQEILIKQRGARPISPHLTIYKPQITWYLSGLHRITGVALAAGFYGLGLGYILGPTVGLDFSSASLAASFGSLSVLSKFSLKFLFSYPFTFHAFNGIRHLVWDTAALVNNKGVVRSGAAVLAISAVSSLVLALL
ncbi:hypothetical protein V1514DRAFT_287680 [Lipomyces japonicus]|uniref:uncharacterized protein n=1 Tax=Lipomyces japonicus TaxID=56871 RepID=UPI0034CE5EA3